MLAHALPGATATALQECTGNGRIQGYYEKGVRCWSGNDDEAMVARHEHNSLVSRRAAPALPVL